jgi:DNA polymerase
MKSSSEPGAARYLPTRHTLPQLRTAVQKCHGCPLYENATQAVFGEGPTKARLVFVGEQPGNDEDLQGRPFVGPAGRLLSGVLDEVGIDRKTVYVTNAVKHFKWEPRGKRRLHKKPAQREIWACRPWLDAELEALKPEVLVCLGAVAAQALFGPKFRVSSERGKLLDSDLARFVIATVHPSSLLRAPSHEDRERERKLFVADLELVRRTLASHSG